MKRFIPGVIFLLTVTRTYAQADDEVAPLKWGAKIGVTKTYMEYFNAQTVTKYDPLYGLHAGILFEIPLTTRFGLQIECAFNQARSSYVANDKKQILRINYLAWPLFMKYYFKNSGLSLYAGPQFSMLLGAKGKGPATDINGRYKPREIAIKTGLEYNFRNKGFISLNYQKGVSDIAKNLIASEIKFDQMMICIGFKIFDE